MHKNGAIPLWTAAMGETARSLASGIELLGAEEMNAAAVGRRPRMASHRLH
jgi:hypothetical protein